VESIGERLRTARENRKLSVRDVANETNITPIYVEALEEEEFDKFPSETYLIGFLRSYADFLRLDVDEMVQAYKGYRIGESVTPLEELTRPTRQSAGMMLGSLFEKYRGILLLSAAVVAVAVVAFLGVRAFVSSDVDLEDSDSIDSIKKEYQARNSENDIGTIRPLQLANDRGFVLVYKGEAVQFMVENKEVIFTLREIVPDPPGSERVVIKLLPEGESETLVMGDTRRIDVEGSPRELFFTLKGLTENRAKLLVKLGESLKQEEDVTLEEKDIAEEDKDGTSVVALNNRNLKIVFVAEFTEKSFVEIYLDGVLKSRGFIPSGTVERWEASEYIQLKIGNAGGIKARINGKPYDFGGPGQVANKVITWKKDVNRPNVYHIEVKDW
jgi:transcriptional regulator with XRE-family HTH domain